MIPFAYIVRMLFTLVIFVFTVILVRFFQLVNRSPWLMYPVCCIFVIACVIYYYYRIEANFNYISTRVGFGAKRPLSLFLRSCDFLIYAFLKLDWTGLAFFFTATVLPSLIVVIQKLPRVAAEAPGTIHGNISAIVFGILLGYLVRKTFILSITKQYLRVATRMDWLRFSFIVVAAAATFTYSVYTHLLAEFVFGVSLGISFDLLWWLRQRAATYRMRRGLLAFTYIKGAHFMREDFISNLLLGRSRELPRIIDKERRSFGMTRNYYLMRCCQLFYNRRFEQLHKFYNNYLPKEFRTDLWFKHIIGGTYFSIGDYKGGITVLTKLIEELQPDSTEDQKLRPHVLVTLASFYDQQYCATLSNDSLERAVDLCWQAVKLDPTCSFAAISLAYYIAKSVPTFEFGENAERLQQCHDSLKQALFHFSRSDNFPWQDASKTYVEYSTIFYILVRGYIYMKMGVLKFARDDFSNCLLIDPLYARGHLHMAELFERLVPGGGNAEDSAFEYLKVMHVIPGINLSSPLFQMARTLLKQTVVRIGDNLVYKDPRVCGQTIRTQPTSN